LLWLGRSAPLLAEQGSGGKLLIMYNFCFQAVLQDFPGILSGNVDAAPADQDFAPASWDLTA
jgi:hypothetical protein